LLSRPKTLALWVVVLWFSPLACASYQWTAIKPAALPALTAARSGPVEREDGTAFEVKRAFDVRITTASECVQFSAPVKSRLSDDGQLIVDGRERPWSFSLRDPVQVEVSQLDRTTTVARIAYAVALTATLVVVGHYTLNFPGDAVRPAR
jgi:hypothetical protein